MSSGVLDETVIASLPYEEGSYPDRLLESVVRHFQNKGFRVAGVIQHDLAREGRSRCDMSLEELISGARIALSEDRGEGANGCRIDQQGLVEAAALIEDSLEAGKVDLLVINKFGKVESEGGGFREVIAKAAMMGIPTAIGVPMRNLDAFNLFADSLHAPVALDFKTLVNWFAARLNCKIDIELQQSQHDFMHSVDPKPCR